MDANFTQDKTIAIKCRQGYPVRIAVAFTQGQAAINVAAYAWTFQISTDYVEKGGLAIASITETPNGDGEVITVNGPAGTVTVDVKPVSTNQIKGTSSFVWELRGSLAGVPELGLDGTITARAKVII